MNPNLIGHNEGVNNLVVGLENQGAQEVDHPQVIFFGHIIQEVDNEMLHNITAQRSQELMQQHQEAMANSAQPAYTTRLYNDITLRAEESADYLHTNGWHNTEQLVPMFAHVVIDMNQLIANHPGGNLLNQQTLGQLNNHAIRMNEILESNVRDGNMVQEIHDALLHSRAAANDIAEQAAAGVPIADAIVIHADVDQDFLDDSLVAVPVVEENNRHSDESSSFLSSSENSIPNNRGEVGNNNHFDAALSLSSTSTHDTPAIHEEVNHEGDNDTSSISSNSSQHGIAANDELLQQ